MINNFYLILIPIIVILINCYNYKNLKLEKFSDTIQEESISDKKLIREIIKKSYNSSVFENIDYILDKIKKLNKGEFINNLGIAGSLNLFPMQKGIVIAFSGEEIPEGWAECNGETVKNSYGEEFITPNISGRFVLGLNVVNEAGNSGGESSVTLEKKHLPKHKHDIGGDTTHTHTYRDRYLLFKGSNSQGNFSYTDANSSYYVKGTPSGGQKDKNYGYIYSGRVSGTDNSDKFSTGDSKHEHTDNIEGGDLPHNNMPPYHVLKYIIKIE